MYVLPLAAGDRRGQLFVIEGRLLRGRRGIHQDEFRAALYRSGVPEMVGLADPVGRTRNIDHQSLRLSRKRLAALIIGQRALRVHRSVPQQQRAQCRDAPSNRVSHVLLHTRQKFATVIGVYRVYYNKIGGIGVPPAG